MWSLVNSEYPTPHGPMECNVASIVNSIQNEGTVIFVNSSYLVGIHCHTQHNLSLKMKCGTSLQSGHH